MLGLVGKGVGARWRVLAVVPPTCSIVLSAVASSSRRTQPPPDQRPSDHSYVTQRWDCMVHCSTPSCSPLLCHTFFLPMTFSGIGAVCELTHMNESMPNAAISHSRVSSSTCRRTAAGGRCKVLRRRASSRDGAAAVAAAVAKRTWKEHLVFFDAAQHAPRPRSDHRKQEEQPHRAWGPRGGARRGAGRACVVQKSAIVANSAQHLVEPAAPAAQSSQALLIPVAFAALRCASLASPRSLCVWGRAWKRC